MRNLLEFLQRYNHWFVFILLEVFSFVLLFQYNSYQGSAWFSSANVVAGKIYDWNSEVESFFSLVKVNKELTQRNLYLESQLTAVNKRLVDISKDSTFLKSSQMEILKQYKLIQAKVVSNTLNKRDNFITIDKGSADGVRERYGRCLRNGRRRYRLPCFGTLFHCHPRIELTLEHQLYDKGTRLFRLFALVGRKVERSLRG
jgi:rod shape-determining protein MreC